MKGIIFLIYDLIFLPFVYRKAADLYVLILCAAALLKVGDFGGAFRDIPIENYIPGKEDTLNSFRICIPFVPFTCLIAPGMTSSPTLKRT